MSSKECKCCYDEITVQNICKYLTKDDTDYIEYHFCKDCYLYMFERIWNTYLENLRKETCKKALKSYILLGLPKRYRDTILNKEFIKVFYEDTSHDTFIEKPLTDEKCDSINESLKRVYEEYEKDESIDILKEIRDVLNKYGL